VLRKAASENWRFSSLVLGIATSVPFQMRVVGPVVPDPPGASDTTRPTH